MLAYLSCELKPPNVDKIPHPWGAQLFTGLLGQIDVLAWNTVTVLTLYKYGHFNN